MKKQTVSSGSRDTRLRHLPLLDRSYQQAVGIFMGAFHIADA